MTESLCESRLWPGEAIHTSSIIRFRVCAGGPVFAVVLDTCTHTEAFITFMATDFIGQSVDLHGHQETNTHTVFPPI